MQNRYAGDIGDFGKYGLLRALWGQKGDPPLGVVWYLTSNEFHNNHGRFTRYLEPTPENLTRFRDCDPALYDRLAQLVRDDERSVTAVGRAGILPATTRRFEQHVNPDSTKPERRGRGWRQTHRDGCLEEAIMAVQDCAAVFMDPDNGLASPAGNPGPKHATIGEARRLAGQDRSVIVYHHIGRQGNAQDQVRARLDEMESGLERQALALLYHRGSARAFLISPAPADRTRLTDRVREFMDSSWRTHFDYPGTP